MSIASAQLNKGLRERCLPLEQAITPGNNNGADYMMNSPLLFKHLAKCSSDCYPQVLDVLPAHSQLIEYFSDVHCKIYLPDCHEQLMKMQLDQLDTEHKLNRALIKMLGFRKQDKAELDLILLWDLPNYLESKVMQVLIEYLLPHCSEQAFVHTYVHTREQMPATPAMYRLHGEEKVAVTQHATDKLPSPMFHKESLQKTLSPFIVERGVLLSNGLQEYLLKRR